VDRSVWNVLKCLATSRKVWIAAIGAAGALALYIKGVISADKLASALVALATAVIVAIAAEDSAEKIGQAKAEPEIVDDWPRCVECGEPATHVAEGPTWYCEEHRPWDALAVTWREV
jgi:hypothetical protein